MKAGLSALHLDYLPSQCNFLTIDCKEDTMNLYHYLLNKGIIARPLHPYKMNDYLRVTIGTETQNARFLEALGLYYEIRS